MKRLTQLLVVTIPLACSLTQGAIIEFEDLGLSDWQSIPADYGSTADVAVSYRVLTTSLSPVLDHLQYWGPGYADLPAVAFTQSSGYYGEVILTPAAGKSVTLKEFDMAAYPRGSGSRYEAVISVFYGSGVVDYGPAYLSKSVTTHFTPDVTSSGPITIRFGTDYDNGINHIAFEVVPEPSTYLAGLSALGMLGLFGWRSRK